MTIDGIALGRRALRRVDDPTLLRLYDRDKRLLASKALLPHEREAAESALARLAAELRARGLQP